MANLGSSSVILPDSRVLSYTLSLTPENGDVIMLSNSLCADQTSWDYVAAKLSESGFRTLRYDQPGHGGSSVPADLSSTTFDSLADDVYYLLKHLGLDDKEQSVSACGVSMGAATILYFVAKYPRILNKVIICDTISSSPGNAGVPDIFSQRVTAARQSGSMDAIRHGTQERWFGREWMAANPEETKRMDSLMKTTTLDGFETCCAALSSPSFNVAPLLVKIGPGCNDAMLMVGEKDADLPVKMEDMRKGIEKGFRDVGKNNQIVLKVIRSAGHVCYIDGFRHFMEALLVFLSSEA